MGTDPLLILIAVAPLFLVTGTHLRRSESFGNKLPREFSIPLLALLTAPTGPPRQ